MEDKCMAGGTSLKHSSALSKMDINLPQMPEEYLKLQFITENTIDEQVVSSSRGEQMSTAKIIQNGCALPFANGPVFFSTLVHATRLTKGDDVRDIIDITLDMSLCDIEYQPGDTIGIIPSNSIQEVSQILDCLHITAFSDVQYELTLKKGTKKKKASIPPYIPITSTVQHVFETCLDIRSVPKKLFLRALCEYTSDPVERRRLQELCSKEGAKEYNQLIVENRVSILELLNSFPSCCPSVERLLEFLPRLQARPYSIASSPLAGPLVHIVFSLVTLPHASLNEDRYGLCTKWLDTMSNVCQQRTELSEELSKLNLESIDTVKSNSKIPIYLRKNNGFSLPSDSSVPLILIGPGTGIAPFIGFLQHRKLELEVAKDQTQFGEIWLFSGCRYSDRDFIFKAQIDDFIESNVLTRFYMAFSREKKDGHVKYAQENIKLHSKEFASQLIDKKSSVFVCGDAKNMAKDVWETIAEVLQNEKSMSREEAYEALNRLKSEQRYLQDIWL